MNRVRMLILTAYLVVVLVGGAVYAQSVSNMVLFTEADQTIPYHVSISRLDIPRFNGTEQDYLINCTVLWDNPARVVVILRAFSLTLSIDNGEPGNMFDAGRLMQEKVGSAAFSLGDAGPRVDGGGSRHQSFLLLLRGGDSTVLNHTNPQGRYVVVVYDLIMSYGFVGTTLTRQVWLQPMVEAVTPIG